MIVRKTFNWKDGQFQRWFVTGYYLFGVVPLYVSMDDCKQ